MAWNDVWEDIFKENEWGKYPPEDLIRFIARNYYQMKDRSELKILELGCGPGANLWYMSREGFTVFGIDGSKIAVERATERLNKEVPSWKGEVRKGDFTLIPYKDHSFDVVIDNEAIYVNSFTDSKKIFAEIFRVLKPNGKIFTKAFATGSWGDGTGEKVGYNEWIVNEGPLSGTGNCRFSSKEDMELLLRDFHIEEFEYQKRSYDNGKYEVNEWVIVASKDKE